MTTDQLVVTIGGLLLIAGIVWFFWLRKEEGVAAVQTSTGYQEVTILVKGGYNPGTIRVEQGRPVRLNFRREEASPCSEQVVLEAFGKSARLPEGQVVPVEFVPQARGQFPFTCSMGMFRGTVIVD